MPASVPTHAPVVCYHCGEDCPDHDITIQDKFFCCEGCKLVYEILHQHDLCEYYNLNGKPGINRKISVRADKFAFLEDEKIRRQLIQFSDQQQTHVTFYIPQIHCSSCLWLLENLHRLDAGIVRVTVSFARKEAQVIFREDVTSLRQVAEVLTAIGYEPYISLQDLRGKKPRLQRRMIYQLGVAGCCFGNIMLLSFPEYFSGEGHIEPAMQQLFRYLNLLLALPVFFYSAQVFYKSAWSGLKHGFLNIDVPIVLAIVVTFVRSVTDVLNGSGAGYFDSMTGIVFFMLIGRILQDKTYQGLSFDRDYTAYFPIAVTVINDGKEIPTALPDIKTGDTLLIHHDELIPADGILVKGKALIDYSFVTGESAPVEKSTGEIIYAGGRQLQGNMELLTIKEVAQSYLTSLWNRDELRAGHEKNVSFVHLLGRNFTWVVLLIAAVTATYWAMHDVTRIWPSVTAILIIACPCALLLAASFTHGHILRILSRHQLYLRNAQAIENMANADHIVFDKTGTLTSKNGTEVIYYGRALTTAEERMVASLAAQSTHPLSKAVLQYCGHSGLKDVRDFSAFTGRGVCGWVDEVFIRLGNAAFTGAEEKREGGSVVYLSLNEHLTGLFTIRSGYRSGIRQMLQQLRYSYPLSVLSGDNKKEATHLRKLMGGAATLRFEQQPQDKLDYIIHLQREGKKVMMIGDGLNDAGALKQSDIGISVTEDSNNFTPASDGIMDASRLPMLPHFIALCISSKRIILLSFICSLIYNITGLYFAVQGLLSPLTAAILMPASSISIILLTWVLCEWRGRILTDKYHVSD